MSDVKLLPCPNPWCTPGEYRYLYEHSTNARKRVSCSCCLSGPYCDTREEAIAAWNARTDHARIVAEKDAEIQRLREALEKAYLLLVRTFPGNRPMLEDEYYVANMVIVAVTDALNPPQQKDGE